MDVLFCASEVAPIIKIGGLGDVVGSLPKALVQLGVGVTVVVPLYGSIAKKHWGIREIGEIQVGYGEKHESVGVHQGFLPESQVPVLFLEHPTYLAGGGKNAFEGSVSETERFAFFSRAIVGLAKTKLAPTADIIHCHDWHTALVPLLLNKGDQVDRGDEGQRPKTLLTIHNLAYQGIGPVSLAEKLGIAQEETIKWDAANGDIDCLLEGILHADAINTVSETYAKEIVRPTLGEGMAEALGRRKDRLYGIVNGLDYETWNPATDRFLPQRYSRATVHAGRQMAKQALQEELKLPITQVPLVAFIGRVEPRQKGIDIIYQWLTDQIKSQKDSQAHSAGAKIKSQIQVIILGTGDLIWEERLKALQTGNEDWLSIQMTFDERLAHLLYAGADYILVPSKFEPCGLPQMIAQRYGALPIVRGVGGLKDTAEDGETGFVFQDYSSQALAESVDRALAIFATEHYRAMSSRGMQKDFSWPASAKKYLALYELLVRGLR